MENNLKETPRYDLWFTDDFGYKIPANSTKDVCDGQKSGYFAAAKFLQSCYDEEE